MPKPELSELHEPPSTTRLSTMINQSLTFTTGLFNISSGSAAIAVQSNDLAQLCGIFSGQAKVAAIIGLCFSIIAIFYFGKYRETIVQQLGPVGTVWTDKVILISIAVSFAVIITRLFYGG